MKIGIPKGKQIFQPSIFRYYVSFREGKRLLGILLYFRHEDLTVTSGFWQPPFCQSVFIFVGGGWSGGMNITVVAKHDLSRTYPVLYKLCVCVFSYSNFEPWPTLPYQVIIIFYPSLYPLPILVFGVKTMGKVDGKTIESRWHNCHALVYLRLGLSQCILNRFRLMRLFNHFFRCSPFFMENFPKLTEIFTPRLPPLSELSKKIWFQHQQCWLWKNPNIIYATIWH